VIGAGADREWLIPLDTEGNRPSEHYNIEGNVVGCHIGPYAGLNVNNPQPGFEYQWEVNPHKGGSFNPAASHRIHQLGGQIVKTDDPEFAVYQLMEGGSNQPAPLDTNTVFNELVLVRIPAENLRRSREELSALNQRRLRRGPEEAFVNHTVGAEASYSSRGPTRFRLADHRSEFHQGGRAEEISTPDSGIVKTENVV